MKFRCCSLAGSKACEVCAIGNGVSSEYYAQLDKSSYIKDILEQERIKNKTEFEKLIDELVEKVAQSDELRDRYWNNKLLWTIKSM